MHTLPSTRVRFGAFELDPSTGELRSAETQDPKDKLLLREQVFQVLRMLIDRHGQIVTREEIKARLWPQDTIVDFDRGINATIKELRRALCDSADTPRYVETLARRGYRLMVPIEYLDSAPGIAHGEAAAPREKLRAPLVIAGRKPQTLLALAAGVLLLTGALGVWRFEVHHHRITLTPSDTIVLADVDNRTGDSVFDDALSVALRYEMEQTPYLNLLGFGKTYATLGQLKLPPTTKITPEIARQICSKTNSRMVISHSIADAGNRYRLEIRALDCTLGSTLAEERADIPARDQIVHELGVTAARLRRRLGEPAESLARFNPALEKATSASLESLQMDIEGRKLFLAGNSQAAIPLFQRGIEIDPDFALLYEEIGVANGAVSHYDVMDNWISRAYQMRDRMTEKHRLNIEYLYYSDATGELDKAYSVLLQALKLFPRDAPFHNNLAHTLLALGQLDRAVAVEDETARLQPSALNFSSAAGVNLNASKFREAESWLDRAEASKFDSTDLRLHKARLAFFQGDREALDRAFKGEAKVPDRIIILRERDEVLQGHFGFSDRLQLQASKLFSHPVDISNLLAYAALENAEVRRVAHAHKIEDELLQSDLSRGQRMGLALALARTGRTDEADGIANEISLERPSDLLAHKYLIPTVRAAIKLQKHDPEAAIDLLRDTVQYDLAYTQGFDDLYPAYIRGLAYLELKDGQSAAREFQKLIDNPGLCGEFITGSLARLQLARAQRLMGDKTSARRSYEDFLTIWKNADPDVPIYKEAKTEYAQMQEFR